MLLSSVFDAQEKTGTKKKKSSRKFFWPTLVKHGFDSLHPSLTARAEESSTGKKYFLVFFGLDGQKESQPEASAKAQSLPSLTLRAGTFVAQAVDCRPRRAINKA
jgi:hypothetical protein